MNPTVALRGSMTWMGIRLSSGSRCPQSPKGLLPRNEWSFLLTRRITLSRLRRRAIVGHASITGAHHHLYAHGSQPGRGWGDFASVGSWRRPRLRFISHRRQLSTRSPTELVKNPATADSREEAGPVTRGRGGFDDQGIDYFD